MIEIMRNFRQSKDGFVTVYSNKCHSDEYHFDSKNSEACLCEGRREASKKFFERESLRGGVQSQSCCVI